MRDRDTLIRRCLSIGICIIVLVMPVVIMGRTEGQVVQNTDNSVMKEPEEQTTQNIDNNVTKEPEDEQAKSFDKTQTEDGVSVRIVSYCNGEEKVLTDCEYSTVQFPYYFEKYSSAGADEDIFDRFYEDDFVWEKTIYAEATGKEYTLYYAQEMLQDSVDKEKVTGYEGHLWVTDEDTRIVKRLFWQSEAPYAEITVEGSVLSIQYADGGNKTYTLEEILKDPAEAVYEASMQIDYGVKEYAIDTEKVDAMTDEIYKDACYRALSGQDMVRTLEGEEVCLKEYWFFQGDSNRGISDEVFLENLIENTKFYYVDFDGDGLPELAADIIGDGLHILKYLPDEEIVEIFFGYERMPYYNLLGPGQLYYHNPTFASKDMWRYDIVDAKGQEIIGKFFDAVEHAVTEMTFEEVFGENR